LRPSPPSPTQHTLPRAELSDPFWALLPPLLLPPRILRPWQRPAAAGAAPAAGPEVVAGLQAVGESFELPGHPTIVTRLSSSPPPAAAAPDGRGGASPTAGGGAGGAAGAGAGLWPRYDVLVGCLRLGGDTPSCRLRWPAHTLLKASPGLRGVGGMGEGEGGKGRQQARM
jgi:hypothetical protein